MSDKAIMNVTDALLFANVLEQRSKDMAGSTAKITSQLVGLHSTWRDAKYDQFYRLFEEATLNLKKFTEHADKYAQYLRRKAGIARTYLDRKY